MKYFLLFVIVALVACSGDVSNTTVEFGVDQCMRLSGGEQQKDVDKSIIAEYEKYCLVAGHDAPLNKYAESENNKIFISMVLDYDNVSFPQILNADSAKKLLQERSATISGVTYFCSLIQTMDKYDFLVVFKSDKTNLTYGIHFLTDDLESAKEYYEKDDFLKSSFSCD